MSIQINGKELIVNQWSTTNSDILAFFQESEPNQWEKSLEQALKVGCLALKNSTATVNVDYVEKEFLKLSQQLENELDQRIKVVSHSLEEIFRSDDGVMRKALDTYLGSGGKLADFFDPAKRDSVVSRMSEVMDKHFGANGSVLQKLLDCSETGSPLAKLKGGMEEQIKDLAKAIGELRKDLAVKTAHEEEYEKGTRKGLDFEQVVLQEIEKIAQSFSDTVLFTGDETGVVVNSKSGDVVVELNPASCKGREVRLVFEAKDRKLGVKSILDELDKAKANRAAQVAVAIFSKQDNLPPGVGAFREYSGNKFICVLDKETLEPLALQLVYKVARIYALMEEQGQDQGVSIQEVKTYIQEIQAKFSRITLIKKRLTQGKGLMDTISGDLEMLRTEVLGALAELDQCLDVQKEEDSVA
ncbi:MAG: hypothetical protein M0Z31_01820 [Clostridia bacterium]|nr:hypothetical protein [Clostridia bacterium]